MPLGIRLTVDFAFKKTFGAPESAPALIGLLNAILDLHEPIERVTILNPFSYQEFADDKQIVLDIRCRDAGGRWFNVEMQVSSSQDLLKRLVYYASSLYVEQLKTGLDYAALSSAITICLHENLLFVDTDQAHHRFQLMDFAAKRVLPDTIEVHTVELTKYDRDERTIATGSKLDQWAFLLMNAQSYEERQLKRLLSGTEFQLAIDTLATIAGKTEDRQMYDQREKARRDYDWGIASARREGFELGREEGQQHGREEGLETGRKEALKSMIQTLQSLLGEAVTSANDLDEQTSSELESIIQRLQQRIASRLK